MTKFRMMLAVLAAFFLVAFTATAAQAASASSGEFVGVGWTTLVSDPIAGGTVLRIPEYYNNSNSYAYTTALQGVLNAKPNQNIQVCAKYRPSYNGTPVSPTISNGVWSVTLPAQWGRDVYADNCVTIKNSGSQPYGSVSVANYGGGSNLLLKNVRIN